MANSYSTFRSTAVGATAVSVKAEPVTLIGYNIINRDTDDAIAVKFYNIAAGSVVVGTSAVTDTVYVPAGQTVVLRDGTKGELFSTALSIAAVKEVADSGTTAPDTLPIIKLYYE